MMVNKLKYFLLALCFVMPAWGEDVYPFDNEKDRQRFQRFTNEMRCPMCQSQNLAGSDSMISQDLKKVLHRLVAEGKSDQEVTDYMVERYGEFVLFKPTAEGTNLVLWVSPFILILLGLSIFGWVIIKKQPPAEEE